MARMRALRVRRKPHTVFFNTINENNPAAGGRNGTQTKKPFSLEAGENGFFCK